MFNALNYAILKTQLQQIAAQGTTGPSAYRSMLWRKTASGNPVLAYPVPESPLYPKISGTFTQSGTGDPSPENIRPITPWLASGAAVPVKRTGKNLLSSVLELGGIDILGGLQVNPSSVRTANFVPILPNTAYVASVNGLTAVFNRNAVYDSNFTFIKVVGSVFTAPANAYYYKLAVANTTDLNTPVLLEIGSVVTAYEPYAGDEISLTAPQEIAAGWMDNEGHGQITHGYIASYVDETVPDGWVSSIGELSAGAQVVYPLATPIDITPTAAPLASLAQVDRVTPQSNVLTASTGNIELTYAKSPIRESDEIATAIAAL